jgi:hypothetical protein
MSDPRAAIDLDSAITLFEREWQSGRMPDIRGFVARLPGWNRSSPVERLSLICELVAVDLEFRWQTQQVDPADSTGHHGDQRKSVEDYVAELDELRTAQELPLMLFVEEYRGQRRCGDVQFLSRLSVSRDSLASALVAVESEIAADQQHSHARRPVASGGSDWRTDPQAPLPYSDFLLQRQIGAGGMGKVYRSLQKSLDRPVAVKFLRRSLLEFPQAIDRFIAEAKTVARLRHPGIVGVHGLGRTPGGGYFIVMDLIDGQDLAALAAADTVELQDAIRWVADVAEAVAYAHEHGIVHCDLKPSNVLIDAGGQGRGRAWVTDFGLARGFGDGFLQPSREPEGTAAFMAPEQIDPLLGVISERTDVYGLGGLLHATLAGQPPRNGERVADVLAKTIAHAPICSLKDLRSDVTDDVARIADKCLSWSPNDRYASATQVVNELRHLHSR